ncbi:hypothetical protein PT285_01895 [Lactobacillus sp. ESL0791]|uniref:hypothetical protein n=1 Tax=Lactobacillus sp. ESL0791 TaxID=2983234 RepID=UPI0023F97366|nr:hypothetical protein [Lactobacillus sp. ESL0791]MDF7638189.1 hypothetical protein [Lactobacillus sp. ESL0791]
MKLKRLLVGLAMTSALFTAGCSQQNNTLSKEQVVSIAKKDLKSAKSGKLQEDMTMTIADNKRKVSSNATFSTANAVIMHYYVKTNASSSSQTEAWMDAKNIYIKNPAQDSKTAWYKQALPAGTQESMKKMMDNQAMPQIAKKLSTEITKVGKVKQTNDNATLTANITDKDFLEDYMDSSASLGSQNPALSSSSKALEKYLKLKELSIKMMVKNKNLTAYNATMEMVYSNASDKDKSHKLDYVITVKYSDFGKYDSLKLPSNVRAAKKIKTNSDK